MASQASLQACAFLLARLAEEIVRLRSITYPGHHAGPKKWLRFTSAVVDTADIYLARAFSDPSSPHANKLLEDAEELGDSAYKMLRYISGADAQEIPHQVVAPFQRLATELGIKNTLIFRAEHLANYELGSVDLSSWETGLHSAATSLKGANLDIEWPVRRLTVPSHAMGMLPHFAVVAHELGHAIQEKIVCDLSAQAQLGNEALDRIIARLAALKITMTAADKVDMRAITERWTNELIADAVGFWIAGPAFFFALFAFLELAGRQYGVGKTHPPSDLRRKHLFNHLKQGTPSFNSVLLDKAGLSMTPTINSPNVPACPNSNTLYTDLNNTKLSAVDKAIIVEIIPYADAIAEPIYKATYDYLVAAAPRLIYSPVQLERDLHDYVDPLCALIPPIERKISGGKTEAASLAAILNVGWIALLSKLDQMPAQTGPVDVILNRKMERLHELLLKAVDLAEAKRIWEENR